MANKTDKTFHFNKEAALVYISKIVPLVYHPVNDPTLALFESHQSTRARVSALSSALKHFDKQSNPEFSLTFFFFYKIFSSGEI